MRPKTKFGSFYLAKEHLNCNFLLSIACVFLFYESIDKI